MERIGSILLTWAILYSVQGQATAEGTCANSTAPWPPSASAVVALLMVSMCVETGAFIAVCILCYKKEYVVKKIRVCLQYFRQTRQRTSAEVDSSSSKSAARWRMNSNSSNTTLVSSNVGSNTQGSKRLSDLHEGGAIDGQVRNSILHSGIQENQHTYEYAESPLQEPRDYEQEVSIGDKDLYWEPPDDPVEIHRQMTVRGYPRIPASELKLLGKLGEGEFGDVFKGERRLGDAVKIVAVKSLKAGADKSERVKLLKEAAIMGQFKHPNVVEFLGVRLVDDKPGEAMLVMEFLPGGDLRNHLLKLRETSVNQPLALKLLHFCQEVAGAVSFLHHRDFVHRDLAARNILLSKGESCKLADFGMSHDMDEDYYYKPKGGMIPVKWTAPEAVLYRKYTTKSDVWSYGMVMYEIWSLGHKPFEDISVDELMEILGAGDGYCQPPPPGCPREIYRTMVECWHPSLHCRPAMSVLYNKLGDERSTLVDVSKTKENQLGRPLEEGRTLHPDLQTKYSKSKNAQQPKRKPGAVGLEQPTYLNDSAETEFEPLYGNI